jgi:hypothetical protein
VHVTFEGNVTSNDCAEVNGAVCFKRPSASSGNLGLVSIVVLPHAVVPGVTAGSAGNSLRSATASATR